jgi:hypothetical protein
MAWAATVLPKRAPTPRYKYGLKATSILAALFNAVFLLLTVGRDCLGVDPKDRFTGADLGKDGDGHRRNRHRHEWLPRRGYSPRAAKAKSISGEHFFIWRPVRGWLLASRLLALSFSGQAGSFWIQSSVWAFAPSSFGV